jgi:hypothetical protein
MATRINDGMRNRLADSAADAFDSGVLEIRTGSQPASAGTAASGTLLATITLPATAFAAAATGVASKSGTWSATAAASGTAGWARFRNTGDTLRLDVSVGQGTGDLSLDEDDIVSGGTVTVNSFTFTMPAA